MLYAICFLYATYIHIVYCRFFFKLLYFTNKSTVFAGYVPPQAPAMMPAPLRPAGCPPGLEYLTQVRFYVINVTNMSAWSAKL